MFEKLEPRLRAKYPYLQAIVCDGAEIWCEKTNRACTQMNQGDGCVTSFSDSDSMIVSLPEKRSAVGCSDCKINSTAQGLIFSSK